MIAVFCRYKRDFESLNTTPTKMFRRIRNINDVRGVKFTGIIKLADWYNAGHYISEAHDLLRSRQPELFNCLLAGKFCGDPPPGINGKYRQRYSAIKSEWKPPTKTK